MYDVPFCTSLHMWTGPRTWERQRLVSGWLFYVLAFPSKTSRHGVVKARPWLEDLHTHTHIHALSYFDRYRRGNPTASLLLVMAMAGGIISDVAEQTC